MPREAKEDGPGEWENVFDFEVASRVIELISTRIYRTAGGVLKELVSNAFDSDAKHVWIETDFPRVSRVTIRDDGLGMTKKLVRDSFSNVGASQKLLNPKAFQSSKRQPIGRFGIGFLSAAHISKHIRLTTTPKGEDYTLEVYFDLSAYFDYLRQVEPLGKYIFGSVRYKEVERRDTTGTVIELLDVERESPFYRAIMEKAGPRATYRSPVVWPEAAEAESEPRQAEILARYVLDKGIPSVDDLSGRDRVLWELGLLCPVRYLPGGPVSPQYLNGPTRKVMSWITGHLEDLDFKVFLDGVEARKPILLPSPKVHQTKWDAADEDSTRDVSVYPLSLQRNLKDGRRLDAVGYLLWQPWRVVPQELRGLYLRVDDVGVGPYDNMLFRAMRGEKPIVRVQFSGELYVRKGLQDALTIDRAGFDEQDAAFVALRNELLQHITESPKAVTKRIEVARAERDKRRRTIKRDFERRERERKTSDLVARARMGTKVHITHEKVLPKGGRRVDFERVSAYPSAKLTFALVDQNRNRVELSRSISGDSRLAAVIVGVDSILSELPEAAKWKRKFSDLLTRILAEGP